MNKTKIIGLVLFPLFLTVWFQAGAQPGNPPTPDDPVPLTGIEFLFAAGGALGGYKLFKRFRGEDKTN